jgi:hypothetical protein
MKRLAIALLALFLFGHAALAQLTNYANTTLSNAALPNARANLGFLNYVSVTDPAYGAKCDGATDDSAAIQTAANAVPAGGILLLPAGKQCNYGTTLTLALGINIKSDGPQSSGQLFWTGDATSDHIVIASGIGPFQAADVRMVATAGATYSVNDTITLNDGCGTHAIVKVARVSGTGVADARITTVGSCTSQPSPTTAITQLSSSGSGTGATFKVFYGSQTTKVYEPEFHNVILGSTTTMTSGCVIRADYAGYLVFDNSRIYGARKTWRGICMSRVITAHIGHNSLIDNLLGESIVMSGTDTAGNQSSDVMLDHLELQGCNLAIASKAAALLTGCILHGDNTDGIFVTHTEVYGSFLGYAVYFGAVNGAASTHSLYFFNDFNVEAAGTWSGSISGTNYNNIYLSGGSWIGANNIDAIHFPAGATQLQIDPSVLIYSNTTDASSPNGIYVNGTDVSIAGTIIGNYNGGGVLGAGVYLDSSSSYVFIGSTASIRQFAAGVQGNSAVGVYTLDAVMQSNTADLSGITCTAFARPLTNAISSSVTSLCPNWSTTGTLAAGGAVSLGSTTNFLGGATGVTITGANSGVTFATVNQYLASNIYYNGGWKYAANGTGLVFALSTTSTNAMDIYTAANNAGGAGAAASLTTAAHVIASSNEWDFPGIVTAGGTITGTNLIPSGSAAPTVGMGLPAAGKLGLYGTTSELFSGATDIWDYGVTTASVLTLPVATTLSSANVLLTGITTGTNADFLCRAATGAVLLQTSACTISSMRFKNLMGNYLDDPLKAIGGLHPIVFTRKRDVEHPDPDWNAYQPQIGLSAENVAAIEPKCAIYEQDGKTPKSYRQECLIAVLVSAVQRQQAEIAELKHH